MFKLKNVRYKEVLQIPDLEIPLNKITFIVGESGGGKTTLIRILNRMISPDEGNVLYKGKSIYEIDPILLRREVVMLPQNPVMFPGTIKENLLIGLEFSDKSFVDDELLTEAMEIVHLDKELNKDTENLSEGEKQRVAIGRVILLSPKVILLDEPSSALDDDTEDLMISNLVNLAKENKITLIMVTHSRKIAEEYGENIIEIKNGKVIN